MTADPRYNYSCIITNEGRYNEKAGHIFDGPEIPYLDEKYALNQYAGYDSQNREPVLIKPDNYAFNLAENIIPSREELQYDFRKFDANHVGPHTYGSCTFNQFPNSKKCTEERMIKNFNEQCTTDPQQRNCKQSEENPPASPTRSTGAGGTNLANNSVRYGAVEGFDPWINRTCFDPDVMPALASARRPDHRA